MPIYEYQCVACEHKLEIIQKISEVRLKKCPECGEESLRKLISAVSFRLKGTGWYETDFKDKPKNSSKENKSSGKVIDKTDKKTDTSKVDSKASSSSSSNSSSSDSSNNSSSSSETKASNSSS